MGGAGGWEGQKNGRSRWMGGAGGWEGQVDGRGRWMGGVTVWKHNVCVTTSTSCILWAGIFDSAFLSLATGVMLVEAAIAMKELKLLTFAHSSATSMKNSRTFALCFFSDCRKTKTSISNPQQRAVLVHTTSQSAVCLRSPTVHISVATI